MHDTRRRNTKKTLHSHLTVNGWQFKASVYVCNGVKQDHYVNPQTGWSAREIHRGPNNVYMGLLVLDETGKSQGVVQRITDLP